MSVWSGLREGGIVAWFGPGDVKDGWQVGTWLRELDSFHRLAETDNRCFASLSLRSRLAISDSSSSSELEADIEEIGQGMSWIQRIVDEE
jgi:hypothetical protein